MATTNMRNPSSAELKEALATLYHGQEIDETDEEVLLDSMRSDAVSSPRYRNLTPLEYVGLFKVDKGPCTTVHGVKDLDVVLNPGLVDSTQLEAGKAWRCKSLIYMAITHTHHHYSDHKERTRFKRERSPHTY